MFECAWCLPVFLQRSWCGIQFVQTDDGWSLDASRYVMSPRKPFITDNRKLISSVRQYLQSNLWGMCLTSACVCLCVFVVDKPVVSVDVEPVPCTQVSMELFDPIYSCGVLRPSGHVVKCFHDVYPDYDELRQVSLFSHPPDCLCLSFPDMKPALICSCSRCCRKRTLSTTMWLEERSGESFCFVYSSTCV